MQQEEEKAHSASLPKSASSGSLDNPRKQAEKVATECMIYGYRNKDSEWKVIDKYERISQGFICEDYPRSDPNSPNYAQALSGGDVVIRANLSADANRKAKRYAGGYHWIKVTFDSADSADRACFFSPQEIDGYTVCCERYTGHGPAEDAPLSKGSPAANRFRPRAPRTLSSSHSTTFLQNQGREQDRSTLPRSFTVNSLADVADTDETESMGGSSITASSATATATATGTEQLSQLHHRHQGQQQPQQQQTNPESEFMTHIPTVRKTRLRPITEALPPQPTITERVLRSIPILSWLTGDIVGDGPQLREDGSFDYEKSNIYWRFWYMVDRLFGTDICGLREEA